MPEGVLAFEAHDKVTGDDYENILVPALQDELADRDTIRCLYVLGSDFTGYDGAALWDDTKIGLDHWGAWERIALVTDNGTYQGIVKAFGFLMPGRVKVFPLSERDAAVAWIAAEFDEDD
jgi:hypothetical protein